MTALAMHEAELDQFAASLRLRRRTASISQGALARLLGVRQSSLCAWEAGSTRPTATHLAAWAAALDATAPQELLDVCWQSAQCGRNSGYNRHLRTQTAVCDPCRAAHTAAQQAWRERQLPYRRKAPS